MKLQQITKRDRLFESQLLENHTYRDFYQLGTMLLERRMTEPEIQKLFKDIEITASSRPGNRTFIGRSKDAVTDVAGAINKAYQGVASKISRSGPVSAFDTQVDKLMDKIKSGAGGETGPIMKAVYKYRDFAKKYPVAQGAIYAGLIALAGLSGAGLGGAALLGGIKAFDKMLLGNKASSALWSGFLTGASTYALSQAAQAWSSSSQVAPPNTTTPVASAAPPADVGEVPGVTSFSGDLPTYRIQAGDTLSQIAQQNKVSVQDLMQANPQITDPNKIFAGQTLEIPAPTGNPVYQGGVGAGGPTATPGAGVGGDVGQGLKTSPGAAPGANITVPDISGAEQAAQSTQSAPRDFVFDPVTDEMVPSDSEIARAIRAGERVAARESSTRLGKIKLMPIREMTDSKATMWNWKLQENLSGQHRRSLQLNRKGVQHLFSVIESYTSAVQTHLAEYRLDGPQGQRISQKLAGKQSTIQAPQSTPQPTQTQIQPPQPEYLRPSRPDAPVTQSDKTGIMSRMGKGLKDFGRQLTTKVTSEKLNTNWKVAGSPTDSDKLFAFLQQQGVPAAVVTDVYQQLNLPLPGTSTTPDSSGTSSNSSQPGNNTAGPETKVAASDIVAQLKSVWEPIISNQENPIGSPAVKAYIKDMWMRSGGTKAMESKHSQRQVDERIRKAVSEVRVRQKMMLAKKAR